VKSDLSSWRITSLMLNEELLRNTLPVAGLGEPLFYYREVGSTNDIAIDLAKRGASHGTLVIAEGQTAGRGQRGKKWSTVPGYGLAISIILKPPSFRGEDWLKYHSLGALAVVEALERYGLEAQIKWPNDVLLRSKKVAGILVEISWVGEQVEYVILGVGINVCRDPLLEDWGFDFPAISIEEVLQEQIDWYELLKLILTRVGTWHARVHQKKFVEECKERLAYRGEMVLVNTPNGEWNGRILGLSDKGALEIQSDHGLFEVENAQVQIRLIDEK
jgi:BirA family biotin operon repressor/biotin-[acetyl-CoA-carboxylase] ligase